MCINCLHLPCTMIKEKLIMQNAPTLAHADVQEMQPCVYCGVMVDWYCCYPCFQKYEECNYPDPLDPVIFKV